MNSKQRRAGGKRDAVARYLTQAIASGRFAPGQRLVEAELTEELGVSRGVLREAFQRLTADGLIEIVPNRGALVRRLTVTEALELFQIRTELEALAARLAAASMAEPCRAEQFRARMRGILEDGPRLSTAAYIEENRRFHDAVVAASGNAELVKLHRQMQLSLIMAQISSALSAEVIETSLAEHRRIAEAILAGDAAAADREIRAHMERAMAFMRGMPGEVFRREAPIPAIAPVT